MNKGRKLIIAFAVAGFIGTSVYVPWEHTFQEQGISQITRPAGYHLIFSPPEPRSKRPQFGVSLDISRLLIQYFVIVVSFSGAFIITNFKNKQQHATPTEKD